MMRQYELVERVRAYDPRADEGKLDRAYVYAMKMHGSQKRASGDPYFSHPIEVAGILTALKLDGDSIVTALLHDTVEDTDATLADIEQLFGPEIARLVDGVTKLTRIELQSDQSKQAENFRKLVLAMSEDIRVLLVKLADRLHNMRTLHFVKSEDKRRRIALETLEIYAPLAERIGIHTWKDELQDLAFRELHPEARESIVTRLAFLREQGEPLVGRIIKELQEKLLANGVTAVEVSGREKSPYSIWEKMKRKNVSFEQLSDIMAFRVLVGSIEQCYQALGVVHAQYPTVPGRFKDYISVPKPNGYRSLHTGVIGPERQRIEMQIRTQSMHETAELGVAAHWDYKQHTGDQQTEGRKYRWIRELLDILDNAAGPEEFLEHTKLEMYQDQVFCFTPKGDLISLPRGATPIDFAYAVHSEVGDRCVGAKLNGRLVPLRAALKNGDQVEIVTSKSQTPSPTWEEFVVTGKAKACIRRFIRHQKRHEFMALGRTIVEKAFRHDGVPFTEKAMDQAPRLFKLEKVEDLYAQVGEGLLTGQQIVHAVFPETRRTKPEVVGDANVVPIARARGKVKKDHGYAVPIRGLIPGMAMHFAKCCHPLPGDRIVGIVTTGKGVTIHTIDCEVLEQFQETPERWLDVAWNEPGDEVERHVGRLSVIISNEPGSLGNLTTTIGKNRGNINNLKITNRSQDFFDILVDVEVEDVKHLTNIIAALRASPMINSVDRARG
ncbi:MAG: bifunctional (p)ppGpp synthetase/guanosine-3',5'-bis(diphosphate) 3'-pyrophosphohydrolase [Alphaproteobacteria bacterium]|nr:bifunctional (p)ppGpp synthetase/guanosine-3',5'-bis(diphosphate) 3'-pyrophosphohydrolase [Alphaproteobacteria bacterium]MBU0796472.1 bifunctional (p)ppGpp synthetase/guanosine-3',5'-bis(diphosphate) 3'-pyrophosphohydrolase [Alphaproteobacteria bacterium]MBU0885653.1 bifunctional (p)ppGpp synthetase/guanosine-3',5'-bis(diphosphate) 3'-pyrophosphohydrolase [Alphaproteobacteria bacterium]MBU1812691.1 bifunctional (p)ppGpp synthetase/guanosine-3',5'-bis(diphosphate) 3'-pyrophosphohydrolase [Alph